MVIPSEEISESIDRCVLSLHPGQVTRWTSQFSPGTDIDHFNRETMEKIEMMAFENDRGC